jgi:wobble nucleotide-excising tRNase
MIESITLANVASYGTAPERLVELSQFNFFFGSNGSGKTTIGRVISDESSFPTCAIGWKANQKLESLVYNKEFVDKNFSQSPEVRGVFTLGEKNVETISKIEKAKVDCEALRAKEGELSIALEGADGTGGKKGELQALETRLKEKCWAQKQKHDPKLQGAFEGFRGSADKFKAKVLQEWGANTAALLLLSDLEVKAAAVFGPAPVVEKTVSLVDMTTLTGYEVDPILKKRVIGKDDVDIAAMIKKLGSSDWVRQGRSFFDVNENQCPFCQQSTSEAFRKSLDDYFDEVFEADSREIANIGTNYATEVARLQQQIGALVAALSKFLDVERLKAEKELFDLKIARNVQLLAGKKKEPSQVVELDSIENIAATVRTLIDAANVSIVKHNEMVTNLSRERLTLASQVWKYLIEVELKIDLSVFKTERDNLNKAIEGIAAKITSLKKERGTIEVELRSLERQTTSIQPTIDAINRLLVSFGFQGFSLANTHSGTSYKLVRADGSDAKASLSEGERTFVTFLYFYHLLKGSQSESGTSTNRVVVFDDPVSSLDSDILFIVGSLIKGILDEVRAGTGAIKQVFILTHNVYFHKEVTFNARRQDVAMNEETFWIVRKDGSTSKVAKFGFNPIKTSYELLWAEVRNPQRTNLSIQNTLRRILENYFKILGGVNPDMICDGFAGKDKMICKSLFSWVNAGSHYAHEDLFVSIEDSTVDMYLRVFREIFVKMDHLGHYRMMMGDAYVDSIPSRGSIVPDQQVRQETTVMSPTVGI